MERLPLWRMTHRPNTFVIDGALYELCQDVVRMAAGRDAGLEADFENLQRSRLMLQTVAESFTVYEYDGEGKLVTDHVLAAIRHIRAAENRLHEAENRIRTCRAWLAEQRTKDSTENESGSDETDFISDSDDVDETHSLGDAIGNLHIEHGENSGDSPRVHSSRD